MTQDPVTQDPVERDRVQVRLVVKHMLCVDDVLHCM